MGYGASKILYLINEYTELLKYSWSICIYVDKEWYVLHVIDGYNGQMIFLVTLTGMLFNDANIGIFLKYDSNEI